MLIEILENEDQYLDPESIVKRNKVFANFSYDFLIAISFLLFDTDVIYILLCIMATRLD